VNDEQSSTSSVSCLFLGAQSTSIVYYDNSGSRDVPENKLFRERPVAGKFLNRFFEETPHEFIE